MATSNSAEKARMATPQVYPRQDRQREVKSCNNWAPPPHTCYPGQALPLPHSCHPGIAGRAQWVFTTPTLGGVLALKQWQLPICNKCQFLEAPLEQSLLGRSSSHGLLRCPLPSPRDFRRSTSSGASCLYVSRCDAGHGNGDRPPDPPHKTIGRPRLSPYRDPRPYSTKRCGPTFGPYENTIMPGNLGRFEYFPVPIPGLGNGYGGGSDGQ